MKMERKVGKDKKGRGVKVKKVNGQKVTHVRLYTLYLSTQHSSLDVIANIDTNIHPVINNRES